MRAMQVNSPLWRGSVRTLLGRRLGVGLAGDVRPRQVDLRLVGPGDHREQDAALGAADDRLDDARILERLGDALHLQLVALLVDRVRNVDGDDERGVDLVAADRGGDGHRR